MKAKDVNWTRELLQRALDADADEVLALAEELGINRNTIYAKRAKIRSQGFEAALRKPRSGGRKPRPPLTVAEELNRVYTIHANRAGRGDVMQHTITIPNNLAREFVRRFNTAIRFVPVEEGLLIVPLERFDPDKAPAWLPPEALEP